MIPDFKNYILVSFKTKTYFNDKSKISVDWCMIRVYTVVCCYMKLGMYWNLFKQLPRENEKLNSISIYLPRRNKLTRSSILSFQRLNSTCYLLVAVDCVHGVWILHINIKDWTSMFIFGPGLNFTWCMSEYQTQSFESVQFNRRKNYLQNHGYNFNIFKGADFLEIKCQPYIFCQFYNQTEPANKNLVYSMFNFSCLFFSGIEI